MVHLKVKQVGDEVMLTLDKEAQRSLGVTPGDVMRLEPSGDGFVVTTEDAVARGKLFVERYIKTFEALAQ